MAEDLVELGLEGMDRLVDKYHDRSYEFFTDHSGRIWKKMRIPGQKKPVFVEQNPDHGDKPLQYDPEKDKRPSGWKGGNDGTSGPNGPNGREIGEQDRDRGGFDREPSYVDDRDFQLGRGLDSPSKVRFNPFKEVRTTRAYYNEVTAGGPVNNAHGAQPGAQYFPPPPRAPADMYGSSMSQQVNQPDPSYLAPPIAAASGYAAGQRPASPRENRRWREDDYSRSPSPDGLRGRSSFDGRRSSRADSLSSEESLERPRPQSEDRRRRKRSRNRHGEKKNLKESHALTASLAGAVAGGFLGHTAGKGDLITAAAGAIVGALGGTIAAEERSRQKDKKKDREKSHYKNKDDRY